MAVIEPSDFDRLKYDLEKRRLELDEQRFRLDDNFFNKNFGVIITGIISIATVVVSLIVSLSQLWINSNTSSSQMQMDRDRNDRSFQFDIAKFLLERKADINTSDIGQAKYIRNVVISFFPSNFAAQVSSSMQVVAETPDLQRVWADALAFSQSRTAAVAPSPSAGQSSLTADKVATAFNFDEDRKAALKQILDQARQFGITGKNDVDLYLALVFQNSGSLKLTFENLNYSASRLVLVFPATFHTVEEALPFANNPEKIANRLYAGRMGNRDPGDGYKYRGRGYLQITGRDNYRETGKALGIDLEANPDQVLDPPTNAKVSAYLFSKATASARQTGSLDLVTANRLINGGIAGLDDTKTIYERIRKLTA
jgi:predicted chitinase